MITMKNPFLMFLLCLTMSMISWAQGSPDFSSPAAATSFQTGGNMQISPSDLDRVNAIMDGKEGILLAARSSGCSSSCSSRCSSGCSVSCSNRCSTSCSSRCGGSSSYTTGSGNSSSYTPASPKTAPARVVPAAPTAPKIEPDQQREIYWEDGYKWQVHNATCAMYAKGKGSPTLIPGTENCPLCGGKAKKPLTDGTVKIVVEGKSAKTASSSPVTETVKKEQENKEPQAVMYWVTTSSGKIHNSSCRYYKNSNGNLTTTPQGTDCKICGGKSGK